MKRLPLWAGLAGALWMVIAIHNVAPRAIFLTNFVGFRTAMMIPSIGREIPVWQDVWIFNSWLILTSGVEWALIASSIRLAVRRFSK
ncbi:MAG: hypothetical protein WBW31_00115 [Candidatus Sulfotelmatobacter sp.]